MPRPESSIEESVGRRLSLYCLGEGIHFKFKKLTGEAGEPDRQLMWEGANVLFVEFKRPGEVPRPLQVFRHQELRDMGFEVRVYDNADVAVEEIKAKIRASLGAGTGHGADSSGERGEVIFTSGKRKDLDCVEVLLRTQESWARRQAISPGPTAGSNHELAE